MQNDFNYKTFTAKALSIALPIALQNFIYNSLNMVDNIMVGQLGAKEVAAVGLANKYFFIFILISFGICSGTGIFISQFWGKQDTANIRKVLGITLSVTMSVGVIFFLGGFIFPEQIMKLFTDDAVVNSLGSGYLKIVSVSFICNSIGMAYIFALRNIHKTIVPMFISAIAVGLNTFFNYLLIFGHWGFPQMGVNGAAIATAFARLLEVLLIILYIYGKEKVFAAKIKELLSWDFKYFKQVYNTVWPVVINEGFWAIGIVSYSAAIARISTESLAAFQIADTVYGLYIVLFFGLGNACAVMIGNKIGAGEEEIAIKYAKIYAYAIPIIGIITGLLLYLSSSTILSFYGGLSSEVLNMTAMIILMHSIFMPVRMFNIILVVGILRSGGDTKFSMYLEMGSIWLVGVPLAFLGALYFHLPVYWVVVLIAVEELVKCAIGIYRVKSKKWLKSVIADL